MKLDDYKLIAARPNGLRSDEKFTEAVMNRITTKKQAHGFVARFRRSPVLAILLALLVIGLISGTAYAVSYLWPQLHTEVSPPKKSTSGRTSVIATNCDTIDSSKRYELKAGAPVSLDKLNDVVKAQCELNTVSDWSSKTYRADIPPTSEKDPRKVNAPNAIARHAFVTPAMLAVQLVRVDKGQLVVRDAGSLTELSVPLSADTKVIINGQYGKLSQLSAGDSLAYATKVETTTKNQATCTQSSCNADVIDTAESTLAVIKLKYLFDVYRSIPSLTELTMCYDNPNDECPSTSSIDLYERFVEDPDKDIEAAQISGKIVSYDDQTIAITTTSGRSVVVHTPWNIIDTFNANSSAGYNLTVVPGYTISVDYVHKTGTKNDTSIDWKKIQMISLLMEAETKAGPFTPY